MDKTLQMIVDFVMAAREKPLPDVVLNRCREILVDTLGCTIGGRDCIAAQVAKAYPARPEGEEGAVVGVAQGAPIDIAAFWNSAMTRALDFNDSISGGHPSDMIGALIAMSRSAKTTGEDMLTAIAISYEVNSHLAEVTTAGPNKNRTLDQGYGVAVGIAAAVSHMLRLSREQTTHAVSLAATNGAPLRASRAGELSHFKGVATAVSARHGIFAVHMARCGMTAPSAPFEGRHGIVELLKGEEGPLNIAPFDSWRVINTRFKFFPVAYNTQIGVWAAIELRKQADYRQLEKITLHTSWFLWHESGSEPEKWDPQTRETADHSLPYIFSRALTDGTITLNTFDMERIRDPEIRTLMQRVEIKEDPAISAEWPGAIQCKLDAVDKAGKQYHLHVKNPRGHELNPLTPEDIEKKFLTLTEPALGPERAASAFKLAWNVRQAPSFAPILDALVVQPGKR